MPKILLILTLLILSSCSLKNKRNSGIFYQPEEYEVEFESVEDQARKSISYTKRNFHIPAERIIPAWDRVYMFFNVFVKSKPSIAHSNRIVGNSKNYTYEIIRKNANKGLEGMFYEVICKDRRFNKETDISILNAKNLARFIKDGTLEVGLLEY